MRSTHTPQRREEPRLFSGSAAADGVWAGRVIGGAGGAGGAGAGAGDGEPVAAGGAGADQDSADGALTLSPRAAARRSARIWEASW